MGGSSGLEKKQGPPLQRGLLTIFIQGGRNEITEVQGMDWEVRMSQSL